MLPLRLNLTPLQARFAQSPVHHSSIYEPWTTQPDRCHARDCTSDEPPMSCGDCGMARYCSHRCQVRDWMQGEHKQICGLQTTPWSLLERAFAAQQREGDAPLWNESSDFCRGLWSPFLQWCLYLSFASVMGGGDTPMPPACPVCRNGIDGPLWFRYRATARPRAADAGGRETRDLGIWFYCGEKCALHAIPDGLQYTSMDVLLPHCYWCFVAGETPLVEIIIQRTTPGDGGSLEQHSIALVSEEERGEGVVVLSGD